MAKAIDIHHHYMPREVLDEARRSGKALGVEVADKDGRVGLAFGGGKPHMLQPALMDVERRLEIMAKGKIAVAALEANTNSLGYRLSGEQGESWCRLYNDGVQQLVRKHPGRFVATAAVPLQEPARAAKVLGHAVGELKFSAEFIGTNVNDRYYNSRDFDPFWAAAEELDVLIVMHP